MLLVNLSGFALAASRTVHCGARSRLAGGKVTWATPSFRWTFVALSRNETIGVADGVLEPTSGTTFITSGTAEERLTMLSRT